MARQSAQITVRISVALYDAIQRQAHLLSCCKSDVIIAVMEHAMLSNGVDFARNDVGKLIADAPPEAATSRLPVQVDPWQGKGRTDQKARYRTVAKRADHQAMLAEVRQARTG